MINEDMKQRILAAAQRELDNEHEDADFVDRTEVDSEVLAGLVELVKEKEPRVLDWDEIRDYPVVYGEFRGSKKIYPLIISEDFGEVQAWNPELNISKEFMLIVSDEEERKNVRCWDRKPTKEQMEATPWKMINEEKLILYLGDSINYAHQNKSDSIELYTKAGEQILAVMKRHKPEEPRSYMDGPVKKYECHCGCHLVHVGTVRWNYCPSCGQAVKWE